MDDDLQLISDGDGLAVIGSPTAVQRFLVSEGLPSKDLGLPRLGSALRAAAGATKVLLHPTASPAVVHSGNDVAIAVVDFHGRLGIDRRGQSLDARRWVDAAAEARDKVLETGAEGVSSARRLGNETLGRARSVTGKLSSGTAGRVLRRRGDDEEG